MSKQRAPQFWCHIPVLIMFTGMSDFRNRPQGHLRKSKYFQSVFEVSRILLEVY